MSQLESDGAVQQRRHKPRPFLNLKLHRRAYFTFTITAIDMIMFIVQLVVNQGVTKGWWLNVSLDSLIQLGAKFTPLILQGQVWRLFTALFLHSGFVHLLLNMFSQLWLGMQTERFLGWWRLALIYFLSGIGGNMASAVFLPETLQVGASSAIFGLFGIFAVDLAVNWCVHTHRRVKVIQIVASTLLSLLVGIAPHIDVSSFKRVLYLLTLFLELCARGWTGVRRAGLAGLCAAAVECRCAVGACRTSQDTRQSATGRECHCDCPRAAQRGVVESLRLLVVSRCDLFAVV